MATRSDIKAYFETGKRPVEGNFAELIDRIPMVDASAGTIEYWDDALGAFVTKQFVDCNCVHVAKLFIPSAEVLTLNTTPKPFGLNVPAGYIVEPISLIGGIEFGSVAYTTRGNVGVRHVGADTPLFAWAANSFLFATQSRFSSAQKQTTGTVTANQFVSVADLEVYVETGNPLNGDSDITLYLTYMLIEI